jgi:ribosome biogenesis GTPase / thiamine phosphate phosphatase
MTLATLGWNERWQSEFAAHATEGLIPGRVVGEHRTHYRVATDETELSAEATGRLRNAAKLRSDMPGVGDYVALRPSAGDGPATVEAILQRTTALIRKASGEQRPQLLASNVDVVFIVTGLDGDFNLARLQRFLALVRDSGARPVIVANKAELSVDVAAIAREIATIAPDVALHPTSVRAGTGLADLEPYFTGNRTVALIGSSGVGKSTLTNVLLEREAQATGSVRSHDSRGRHTTTHRQLFIRPRGGTIIDTPGLRGLEAWNGDAPTADFADIEEFATQCRFSDCQHRTEPKCAVAAAVASGALDAARLAEYLKLPRKGR